MTRARSFGVDRLGTLVVVVAADRCRECRRHPGNLPGAHVDRPRPECRANSSRTYSIWRSSPASSHRRDFGPRHRVVGARRRGCAVVLESARPARTRASQQARNIWEARVLRMVRAAGLLDPSATTGSTSADTIASSTSPGRRRRSPPSSTALCRIPRGGSSTTTACARTTSSTTLSLSLPAHRTTARRRCDARTPFGRSPGKRLGAGASCARPAGPPRAPAQATPER